MPHDIIADIHGHADELEALLRRLGYRETAGAWRHPSRTAVFVGDFIDRGPRQIAAVDLVRRMVDSGSALAVMGNHELNAIAYATPDDERPGKYLRPHSTTNTHQHQAFLHEVGFGSALHAELISWFLTLPLWLELPSLRVVHACWHQPLMEFLRPSLAPGERLTPALVAPATRKPAPGSSDSAPSIYQAVEALTKGIEVPLPAPHTFVDKDGHQRQDVRVRWWDPEADTFRRAAIVDDELRARLPDTPLPPEALQAVGAGKPVFFGHYWLTGTPTVQSPRAACLDYSVARGGSLVAYRWDGEPELTSANLTWVNAESVTPLA